MPYIFRVAGFINSLPDPLGKDPVLPRVSSYTCVCSIPPSPLCFRWRMSRTSELRGAGSGRQWKVITERLAGLFVVAYRLYSQFCT
jgi:hypothetical protein